MQSKGFFTGLSPKRETAGREVMTPSTARGFTAVKREAMTPSTAREFTASPPQRDVTGRGGATTASSIPTFSSGGMQLVTPSSARENSPIAPNNAHVAATMAVIPDNDEDDDEYDEDAAAVVPGADVSDGNNANGNFSVIVGKTFEAMTLPDGSQQIVETTRYRRLRDGYVYTETKVRSLDDDKNRLDDANDSETSNGAGREDDVVDVDNAPTIAARDEMMADARLLQESSRLGQQSRRAPFRSDGAATANDASPFGSPIKKGGKYPFEDPALMPTFSISSDYDSTTGSNDGDASSRFPTSVTTEDHAFGRNRVEEFRYDDADPTRSGKWRGSNRPLSPRDVPSPRGWCAFGNSFETNNGGSPDSLMLGRPRHWWSFTPRAFAAPSGMVKSIFHSDGNMNDGGGSVSGFPLGYAPDGKDSDDGGNDDEERAMARGISRNWKGRTLCNAKKFTRRCRFMTYAASLVVVIGAIVAIVLVVPSKSTSANQSAEPPPPPPACVNLEVVVKVPDQSVDVNVWSLDHVGADGKAYTINESEMLPEKSSGSNVYKRCVEPGVYTFSVSDPSGNGLGSDGEGGYYIIADGVTLGISSFFFHDEKMTFTLPFDDKGAKSGDDGDEAVCTDDFFLAVSTDNNPGETTWNVIDNDTGDEVLAGGPYSLPLSVYTQRACLPNGSYTFNMFDDGGDGLCCNDGNGFFLLSKDGKTIVNSSGEFGAQNSVAFTLGDEDV